MNTNPRCRLFFGLPVAAIGAIAMLAGCASGPGASGSDSVSGGEASAQTAPATIAAEAVFRPAPWKKTYSEGKRTIRREARQDGDSPNTWVIDEFDSPDGQLRGGLVRQTFLERGPDGSVFLRELHLIVDKRILTFNPPVVLMPPVLSSAKPCVSSADVLMRDGESQAATRTRGTATQTTRLLRQQGGLFVIESQLSAKFDFTTIDRTAVMEVSTERGVVREVQDRSVRVGLFNLSRKTSSVVLVLQPDQ